MRRLPRVVALARGEGELERVECAFVVAGVVTRPADVVVQRPEPVADTGIRRRARDLDPARGPRLGVLDEREHVRRVGGENVLPALPGELERATELRETEPVPAGRPLAPATFEERARGHAAERLRLV